MSPKLSLAAILAFFTDGVHLAEGSDDAPGNLSAALISPTDIELKWSPPSRAGAGQIVEFATEEKGIYTILDFLPIEASAYKHRNLMPGQRYFYRVRAYDGPTSNPVVIETSSVPAPQFGWSSARGTRAEPEAKSLRKPFANPEAAPRELRVHVDPSSPTLKLEWRDLARQEDGFLVELAASETHRFIPSGLLERDTTSCSFRGAIPPSTRVAIRIRAFVYGAPSNIVSADVPPES